MNLSGVPFLTHGVQGRWCAVGLERGHSPTVPTTLGCCNRPKSPERLKHEDFPSLDLNPSKTTPRHNSPLPDPTLIRTDPPSHPVSLSMERLSTNPNISGHCNPSPPAIRLPEDDQNIWLQFYLDIDSQEAVANLEQEHFNINGLYFVSYASLVFSFECSSSSSIV